MKAKQWTRVWIAIIATCALSRTVVGQVFDLSWYTFDGGGTMNSAGGSFALSGTIGQPDAGSPAAPMSGGAFSLVGGFWVAAATNACPIPGDTNADGAQDGIDVQTFVNCLISGGPGVCPCADVDSNGTVSGADVAPFVQLLLN